MPVKITNDGIDTIQDNTVTPSKIEDSSIVYEDLPKGVVVQVQRVLTTARTSYVHSTSDYNVPGMIVGLTPKLNNSKFLITVRSFGEVDGAWDISYNILADGSRINVNGMNNTWNGLSMYMQSYSPLANNNDSTPETLSFTTLWSSNKPAGVPISFTLAAITSGARTSWINGCFNAAYETGTSEMTVMEIKGY